MVNTYEYIKLIENDSTFVILLKKGLIPISVLDKKCYYESFLKELKINTKAQAIANTSEDYRVSEMTIRRAITFMEG